MPAPRSEPSQDFASLTAAELAQAIARILDERQASDLVILDVSGPLVIADYFVIATARNPRHARGLARELDFALKHGGRLRRNASGTEGESNWVLLDFDEVVVHLFVQDSRSFYALEDLWADVPRVPFTPAHRTERGPAPTRESPPGASVVHPRRPGDGGTPGTDSGTPPGSG